MDQETQPADYITLHTFKMKPVQDNGSVITDWPHPRYQILILKMALCQIPKQFFANLMTFKKMFNAPYESTQVWLLFREILSFKAKSSVKDVKFCVHFCGRSEIDM